MTYITTKLIDGQAYAGPRIEADSLDQAQAYADELQGCQVAGQLEHEEDQEPL